MSIINSKEINDKIASLPYRNLLSKELQRQEDIAAINDYALRNPDKVFNDDFREQRKHLSEETWKAVILANPDMLDSASDKWRKIPDANIVNKYQGQAFSGEVRKAINEDGVKLAGLAAAVPGAIIGTSLLAEVAPSAINFLTKAGEKAYPFTLKWIEPVFNKMNPFSKEFALMGLAGKSVVGGLESLGALHAINTTADFIKDPKVYKIPDVVMADMIGLPYGLAAGQKLYGAYNRAAAPFRMARLMNLNVKNTNLGTTVFDDAVLLGKVGWAPSLVINYRHGSDNANLKRFIPYATWDVEKHGASPFKFFGTEVSSPRNMMDERPFLYFGSTELNKPVVLIGEFNPLGVKNDSRNLLVNEARRRGADSYYLLNIADNKAKNQNVLIKFIGQEGEQVGKPTSVKWYGPTMGKTTATKIHDELVDIDPLLKPIRQKYTNILGLDIRDPRVSQHPDYKLAVVDFVLDWKMNPENQGKTLLASTKHLLDPEYKIQFGNDPSIPDFETFAARNKARGFKETDELLRAWYDSIFKQGRDLNIDNRFVLDIEGLLPNSHLQGDDAVKMFKQYLNDAGDISLKESINIDLLKRYIPEARERYGLVGNDNITDDEILKALYHHTNELGKGTAAVNASGEPLLLFRGDTKRYTALQPRLSPEELANAGGTMDNSLGTLFLGELPFTDGGDAGILKYLNTGAYAYSKDGTLLAANWRPSQTGGSSIRIGDKIYKGWQLAPNLTDEPSIANIPKGSVLIDAGTPTLSGLVTKKYKLPASITDAEAQDINAFVVKTPGVYDMTNEMLVLSLQRAIDPNNNFTWLTEEIPVSFMDKDGFPLFRYKGIEYPNLANDESRVLWADLYKSLLNAAKNNNKGLLKSESTDGFLRREHPGYTYFALPNFNIKNAKHILPYDLRIPRNWEDPIIYRKQGGTINYLNLFK